MDYVRIFRPFCALQLPKMENWLKEQAMRGYRLVHYKHWTFTFVKCQGKERAYCMYLSPLGLKRDLMHREFYGIKQQYRKRDSEFNRANRVGGEIFEIDMKKADHDLLWFFVARHSHYRTYSIRMMIVYAAFCAIFGALSFVELALVPFSIVCLFPTIYYAISTVVSSHQKHHALQNIQK